MNQNPVMFPLIVLLQFSLLNMGQAETINVADHGVVPGVDATEPLKRLIASIKDQPETTLFFPKAQYDFYPDNAVEVYRAVANHDNGLKRIGFPLFDCRNLTIDGDGSTFMFHGRMVPLTLDKTHNLTLKNFSIDWVRSFHAELEVVEHLDKNNFVVQTDPKLYPYQIQDGKILFERFGQLDPIGSNIVFDPKTHSPIFDTRRYRFNGHKATFTELAKGRIQIENGSPQSAPPVGSVLVTYGVHPTSRLCPAIHVTNSSHLKIDHVTVYEAGGMALIVERTKNVTLDAMVVTSTQARIAATRADATHFIGCQGTIWLENCRFEHMLDDGINVHGAYVKVAKYLGEKRFLCEISHFQQTGMTFAETGDKIALLSRTTILPFFQTTVTSTKVLDEKQVVVTVAEMPDELPEGPMSMENLTWYPDVVMRKNTIRQNRARGALITTKGKVLIENNYFSNQMHGILIEGDNNKWYESGGVNDVTIRNNVFENVGFGSDQAYPLLAAPLLNDEQHWGDEQYHRNINFIGNTIKTHSGHLVEARSVSGLKIEGNQIELSHAYPELSKHPAIKLEFCNDVSINDNQANGFDRALEVQQSKDTSNVSKHSNQNFRTNSQPNIVLMFVDDLGWSDLGYRNPKFETPNIDQLAADGQDFQQAYIACPTCSPSRATLLTGKHPVRLGIVRHIPNDAENGFDKFGRTEKEFNFWKTDPAKFPCRNWLPLEHTTYAEALRDLGYYNQFVGKWHLGHEEFHPTRQGFDSQFGTSNAGHPKSYYPPYFKNSEVLSDEKDKYLTDKLTDASVKFIEDYDREQPFMLSMWYYNVHRPPVGREDLVKHFRDKGYRKIEAVYAAQVKAMDESVGRIRAAIAKQGIENETLVIFLSDQGGIFENPPFRGGKKVDTLCEGGARVPLIVHWPGVTQAGSQNNSLVQSTDLFPTLVEIAGGEAKQYDDLDGVSLVQTLRNNGTLERTSPLIGYRAYEDLYASVRERDWKLLAYRSGKVSLYNLANDLGEKHDLSQSKPEIVKQLVQQLADWEKEMNVQQYSGVQ